MGTSLGQLDVSTVVDGHEDVRRLAEVGEGILQGPRVGGLHQHEAHRWPEEHDVGRREPDELLALEISADSVNTARWRPLPSGGSTRPTLPRTRYTAG